MDQQPSKLDAHKRTPSLVGLTLSNLDESRDTKKQLSQISFMKSDKIKIEKMQAELKASGMDEK